MLESRIDRRRAIGAALGLIRAGAKPGAVAADRVFACAKTAGRLSGDA